MRQKGFTLIELLVAMAVGGVLMMGIVAIIFQVTTGTSRSNSQVVALTDVHQAALQLKKDLQMTQSADFDPPEGGTVKLSWIDYTSFELEENKRHSSRYELSSSELQRTDEGATTSIVGRNITSVDITQDPLDDRVIKVVITATGPMTQQRSKTLEFSVYLRGEGIPQ